MVLLLFSTLGVTQSSTNLLQNGSFHEEEMYWKPQHISFRPIKKSENIVAQFAGHAKLCQAVALPSRSKSIVIKGKLKATFPQQSGSLKISLALKNKDGVYETTEDLTVLDYNKNTPWASFTQVISLPKTSDSIQLICITNGDSCDVHLDDLKLIAKKGNICFLDEEEALPLQQNWAAYQKEKTKVVTNGGFEKGLAGWPDWAGSLENDEVYMGNGALKVEQKTMDPDWLMRRQKIMVPDSTKAITISVWMKTDNVFNTPANWEGAKVYAEIWKKDGQKLAEDPTIAREVKTTPWKKYTTTITIDENVAYFWLNCGLARVPGTAYFDNIKVTFIYQ